MPDHTARRGRPMDPALSGAVLAATLELLEERGFDGLRVDEVASRAGVGLGAVYRRWPSKRELVVAAVRSLLTEEQPRATGDVESDLVTGLVDIAQATTGRRGALTLSLLSDPRPAELADAIRDEKIAPLIGRNRELLGQLIGDVADLDLRADLGPALIVFRALVLGRPLTRGEIKEQVVPLMRGELDV